MTGFNEKTRPMPSSPIIRAAWSFSFATIALANTAFVNGDYNPRVFDADGLFDTVPDPFIREIQCDGSESVNLSGHDLPLARYNIMTCYDSEEKFLSPEQTGIVND